MTGPEGRDAIGGFERILFSDATIVLNDGNPLANDLDTLARDKDVLASGMDADDHSAEFGAREGRDPAVDFDTQACLKVCADVAQAGIASMRRFLQVGPVENRMVVNDGHVG